MSLYTKMKGNVTYTIIGNPTIENSIASNFSLTNYCKLNTTFTPGIKPWKIQIKIKFDYPGIGVDKSMALFNETRGDYRSPKLEIRAYTTTTIRFKFNASANGSGWNISGNNGWKVINYDYSKWYYFTCEFTGTQYLIKYRSEIDTNFTTILIVNNSNPIYQANDFTGISIGADISSGEQFVSYFTGSIDLNETYININRLAWFGDSFSRVKVRTGLTKYTVVGSPTIENGIASNFSNNNYLELHNFDPSKPFELRAKINTTQIGQRQVIYGVGTAGVLRFLIFTNGKIEMDLGTSTSSFNICTLQSSITLSINTDYWVSLVFTGNKYIMSYSTDGDTFTELGSVNSTLLINNGNAFTVRIGIGVVSSTTTFFKGSIDLNASYIKTNNGYFFRGSHQNINFWKIRDSHKDSWYKIVDGKLISANENIYLESTGTQWIDTGIKANQNTILKCKVATIGSGNQSFFGLVDNSNIYGIGQQASGSLLFAQYYGSGSYRITAMAGNDGIARKFEFIKNEFYIDGVLIGSKTYKTFTTTNTIKLFTLEPTRTLGKDKGYYFEIYDDTVLIRKFVPVPTGLKIGDFIIPSNGMFDIVNQQFYENQGTGDFIINKD